MVPGVPATESTPEGFLRIRGMMIFGRPGGFYRFTNHPQGQNAFSLLRREVLPDGHKNHPLGVPSASGMMLLGLPDRLAGSVTIRKVFPAQEGGGVFWLSGWFLPIPVQEGEYIWHSGRILLVL